MRRRAVAIGVGLSIMVLGGCAESSTVRLAADSYKEENRALLSDAPVYPGARAVEREDAVATEDESEVGWTTRVVYQVDGTVQQEDVLRFYGQELADWRVIEECSSGLPVASYRRGQAVLSVNADNAPLGRYEVTVDSHSRLAQGPCPQ